MMEEVEVFRGEGGSSRAQFLEASLEEAGVPAVIKTSGGIAAHPFTVGPMGEFRILVSPDDQERAQDILRSLTGESVEDVEEPDDDDDPHRKLTLDSTKTPAQRTRLRISAVPVMLLALYLFYRGGATDISLGIALVLGAFFLYSASRMP